MNTIKTNSSQLLNIISQAYYTKQDELPSGDIQISFEEYWNINKTDILLYSMITKIILPDDSLYPILKSNYGIPAGLLTIEPKSTKNKKDELKLKDPDNPNFIRLRRAFLYATAWYIKYFDDLDVIKECIDSISYGKSSFILNILDLLGQHKYYPEEETKQNSLKDTHYDFASLWFGKQLAAFYFPKEKKMDNIHKNWYQELRSFNIPLDSEIPKLYMSEFEAIASYIIVLKANEEENFDIKNLLRLAEKINSDRHKINQLIFYSLIYIGIYKSNADHYYYTANAGKMMTVMEMTAYIASKNISYDLSAQMSEAITSLKGIDSKENCVVYYQTKNPGIQNRQWIDFNENTYDANKINILTPDNADKFLKTSGKVVDIPYIYKNGILVVNSDDNTNCGDFNYINIKQDDLFDIHINNYQPGKKHIGISLIDDNDKIQKLSLHLDMTRPIGKECKVWIIQLTSVSGLTEAAQNILSYFYKYNKPEKVMIIYHLDGIPEKDTKNKKEKTEPVLPDYPMIISKLQRVFDKLFYQSQVHIIKYDPTIEKWETIAMGEKILENYDFYNMQILEMRLQKYRTEAEDLILRMVRDVIIYDENMKYLFMNLNS